MFSPRAIFFDLDGTLADTVPDIAVAVDRTLTDLSLPCIGETRVRRWVGNGAVVLLKRALTNQWDGEPPDSNLVKHAYQRFKYHYSANICQHSRPYAGVVPVLNRLRSSDMSMACITNKPIEFTLPLLDALNLREYFQIVLGGDSLTQKKPHPAPLLHACRELGVKPVNCLMVGDSKNDSAAALAAGMPVICVTYGYHQGESPKEFGAHVLIDAFDDMMNHLSLVEPQSNSHET